MVSSVLRITSQVEHTKECNGIDSESKSVLRNADHQNRLIVYFYMLLQYYHMVKKCFGLNRALQRQALADQISVIVSIDQRTPATILPVFYKQMLPEFYRRKGYQKSNAIHIMAIMCSRLWRPLYPLFSYYSTLYRLEVMSRCCNNISYIFIHTYVRISTVKHPNQNK